MEPSSSRSTTATSATQSPFLVCSPSLSCRSATSSPKWARPWRQSDLCPARSTGVWQACCMAWCGPRPPTPPPPSENSPDSMWSPNSDHEIMNGGLDWDFLWLLIIIIIIPLEINYYKFELLYNNNEACTSIMKSTKVQTLSAGHAIVYMK